MDKITASVRIAASLALACLGIIAVGVAWLQPEGMHVFALMLLTLTVVAPLAHPHWSLNAAVLLLAVALYASVVLAGETPLASTGTVVRTALLYSSAAVAAWGLSTYIQHVEQTVDDQVILIDELSIYDQKTGAIRESHFVVLLTQECKRAQRYQVPLSLAAIRVTALYDQMIDDTDRFISNHGKAVTDLLAKSTRTVDQIGQVTDESYTWLVLLPHTDVAGAETAVNRIVRRAKQRLDMTVAAGIVTFPEDGSTSEELLEEAKAALEFACKNDLSIVSRTLLGD